MRRRRVDWDEEIRKTERIRHKGFFISAMSFAFAMALIAGARSMGDGGIQISRKIIVAACLCAAFFIFRVTWKRRERMKKEQEDRETLEALKKLKELRINSEWEKK
ncbi:hypothetical protein FACS1894187_11900 [Synergistales bacterium]|nr:hypothetical protein FACS1894187_11900 [Synergistales bacterium]